MPNDYFQFKQFRVDQDETAMKVTTESCLFGALSEKLTQPKKLKRILDLGAGTGLLALMKAQQTSCLIDAIELDPKAFYQAKENFAKSPWSNRIQSIHENINNYRTDLKYDLIISNPPFFEDHYKSSNPKKNLALHTNTLNYEQLAKSIDKLLSDTGVAHILLPPRPMSTLLDLMKELNLYSVERIQIYNLAHKAVFREVVSFSRHDTMPLNSNILIKDELNKYTTEFVELLNPYYLHL